MAEDEEVSMDDLLESIYIVWAKDIDDNIWYPHSFDNWGAVLDFLQLSNNGWIVTKPVYIDEPK